MCDRRQPEAGWHDNNDLRMAGVKRAAAYAGSHAMHTETSERHVHGGLARGSFGFGNDMFALDMPTMVRCLAQSEDSL